MPRGQFPRGEFPRKLNRDCKQRLAEIAGEQRRLLAAERELARQRKALDDERDRIQAGRKALVA